ncbi:MAG: protein kinase [Planctomycetota bacterium]
MADPEFDYLGPYHVEKVLGRGGMGTVYKGVHAKNGEVVAIKVISTAMADQSRFRRRFEAEIKTLQKIKHPNIVTLKGVGEEKGLLFYTMEFVDGYTLHELMRKERRIPWEDVVEIGIQTTSALKHAHDLGIIHRDLKPANLMLTKEGEIKLTDFGIAKLFGASDMTAAGSVIGTADYMPPEQAEGKTVTVKSDLYGLGGVLYALLVGKPPFSGKSVPEVLYAVRYSAVPRIEDRVDDIPQPMCELIHELLEKGPSNRPPTALVVGNRLKSMQKAIEKTRVNERIDPPEPTAKSVEKKMTSLDLSDVEDDELKMTNASAYVPPAPVPSNRDSSKGSKSGSSGADSIDPHDQATMLAPSDAPGATGDQKPTAYSNKSSQESLEFEQNDFPSQVPESQLTSGGPSHYTPVAQSTRSEFSLATESETQEEEGQWLQIVSIIGIIVLLLGCIGVGWWMMPKARTESELYDAIMAAADEGDDSDLLAVKSEVQEFLNRFPTSESQSEVQALADSMELMRWTQILARRARSVSGAESLSALEQGFLDCMVARNRDPEMGQKKVAAFLKVFGPIQDLSRTEEKLIELAQFALEAGKNLRVSESKAAVQLQAMIQKSEAALSGEKLDTYYRDLLLLFGDKPWARDQMARIRKKLEPEN